MANSPSIDSQTHETAVRLAVQCRRIVQACLREEEWVEADREFYEIIRAGLKSQLENSDTSLHRGIDEQDKRKA